MCMGQRERELAFGSRLVRAQEGLMMETVMDQRIVDSRNQYVTGRGEVRSLRAIGVERETTGDGHGMGYSS